MKEEEFGRREHELAVRQMLHESESKLIELRQVCRLPNPLPRAASSPATRGLISTRTRSTRSRGLISTRNFLVRCQYCTG